MYHSEISAACFTERECVTFGDIRVFHGDLEPPRDARGLMLIWFKDDPNPIGVLRIEQLIDGLFLVTPRLRPAEPYAVGFEWMARVRAVEIL